MAPVAPFTHSITAPSSRYAGIVLDGRLLCAARAQQAAPVLRRQCSVTLCKAIVKEQPLPITSTVATDASVPEGHKGLHGFLYGSGGAEEHDDGEAVPSVQAPGVDDGSMVVPVQRYLDSKDGGRPLGVYCVYDAHGALQFVGYSRNMLLSIKGHLARLGPSKCASVRCKVFANKAMASRTNMEREVQTLLEEHAARHAGALPPGNAGDVAAWEDGEVDASSIMSPAERERYESKKLKLRKAMGEVVALPGVPVEPSAAERREMMKSAMEKGDWSAEIDAATDKGDWSAEIDSQTRDTITASAGASSSGDSAAASTSAPPPPPIGGDDDSGPMVSPFANEVGAAVVEKTAGRSSVTLTIQAAEAALDEVRPYLLADGGDVQVVSVDGGVVALRLQGSCSTCASSAATMKNGIEKVIMNTFGDQVKKIVQLDAGAKPPLTVAMVDLQLNMLRGAIHNFGGAVEVVSVEDGRVSLRFIGPPAIGKGIAAAVKDAFAPDVKEVLFVLD